MENLVFFIIIYKVYINLKGKHLFNILKLINNILIFILLAKDNHLNKFYF